MTEDITDTSRITDWRSIVTLIVFVVTNVIVLFPFHIPIYVPTLLWKALTDSLAALRIASLKHDYPDESRHRLRDGPQHAVFFSRYFVLKRFPMNFITAPLIADLFLLAIGAIGRQEVKDGTIGSGDIIPIDIMAFFITLAYIAISIDASGLIRFLAFKVLVWGGKKGNRLFFFLYTFFFGLGSFIGNDPIILSGTAFLAYMTRVSKNIQHPRAWIHTQFAVANIASAILVSSNPTNLVLAGAFHIKFIEYTANMIVPVLITAIALFPFLLYIVFSDQALIPYSITMHELPDEVKNRPPVNPNIPNARGNEEEEERVIEANNANQAQSEKVPDIHSLEEVMNPFLDKNGAAFGAVIMAVTLVTLLGLNAASQAIGIHPVFYVTLPAAFIMLCWDLGSGWVNREETRKIAREGREKIEKARRERAEKEEEARIAQERAALDGPDGHNASHNSLGIFGPNNDADISPAEPKLDVPVAKGDNVAVGTSDSPQSTLSEKQTTRNSESTPSQLALSNTDLEAKEKGKVSEKELGKKPKLTLVSLSRKSCRWASETFPTVAAVFTHLPFALVPFAFAMFVLVQALVTKGWVPVFAYGWDHWVDKTGTIGAIGGMGFLSVILCNFAGTNIGTTILLCRVVQSWVEIHNQNGIPISDRTFWATVYSMALGVNYGAFSTAFSASLAGLLWRDILARKHIKVSSLEFARVNLPIIAISMSVGCAVLIGEIYIIRKDTPYVP